MPKREVKRLTLYGDSISGNCMKPKWTADLLGIEYDWVEMDLLAGAAQTEEFLAVNPVGQVPLARWPDGRVLPVAPGWLPYPLRHIPSLSPPLAPPWLARAGWPPT